MATILVVDDELGIRELLNDILYDEGYTVLLSANAKEATQARRQVKPDLILLDIWMPGTDGITVLRSWKEKDSLDIPVVMMSGHATIDTVVETMRLGAKNFLEKPITLKKLLKTTQECLKIEEKKVEIPQTEKKNGRALVKDKKKPLTIEPNFNMAANLRDVRDQVERYYFRYHLDRGIDSMTLLAEQAGLERTHLYRKLRQLGISLPRAHQHKLPK
jgi:DNA-binding NtrC family response regulator